jgi:hypothetical protein
VERLVGFRHQSVHAWPDIGFGRLPHSPLAEALDRLPDTTEEDTMIDHEIFAAQVKADRFPFASEGDINRAFAASRASEQSDLLPGTGRLYVIVSGAMSAIKMAARKNSGRCAKVGAALRARRHRGGSDRHRARRDRLPGGGNLWYRQALSWLHSGNADQNEDRDRRWAAPRKNRGGGWQFQNRN